MYMVMVSGVWPLATGYDEYGDPEGYIYGTVAEAKESIGSLSAGAEAIIYELTKVHDSEE